MEISESKYMISYCRPKIRKVQEFFFQAFITQLTNNMEEYEVSAGFKATWLVRVIYMHFVLAFL